MILYEQCRKCLSKYDIAIQYFRIKIIINKVFDHNVFVSG